MLRAAVIVPVVLYGEPEILFVRRAAHLRRNAGEVAFPGGLVDLADADDLEQTARREFEEEIGIPARLLTVLGPLPPVVVVNQTVEVRPFVALLRGPIAPNVDHREVETAFTIPLEAIARPGALHEGVERVGEREIQTWIFDYETVHVWGATARILAAFLAALRGGDPELCGRLDAYDVRVRRDR